MTEASAGVKMGRMPNAPKTPVSNFRIPPLLKAQAQEKAAANGESLTDVVVRALEKYVKTAPKRSKSEEMAG